MLPSPPSWGRLRALRSVRSAPQSERGRNESRVALRGGLPVRRNPLSPHGRARMAGSLPLQRLQDAIRRGFRHEPQDTRGRCQAHQRRAEVLDTPLREWRAGQKLLFLRNLRDTPLAHRRIRLLEHQTRHARRFVAVGTALRGMDEAQGALANDRRARGQPLYTARDSGPGLSPENLSRLFEHSTRPSPRVWAWAYLSAARSSKPTAGGCGRSRANCRAHSFSLRSPLTEPPSVIDVAYGKSVSLLGARPCPELGVKPTFDR
jgi:hypothetical protein